MSNKEQKYLKVRTIINLEAVDDLSMLDDGNVEFLEEVVTAYLEYTPDRISKLKDTCLKNDWKLMAKEAHGIKSSSGNVGAKRVEWLAQKIESEGLNGEIFKAEQLVRSLEIEFSAAKVRLTKELQARFKSKHR